MLLSLISHVFSNLGFICFDVKHFQYFGHLVTLEKLLSTVEHPFFIKIVFFFSLTCTPFPMAQTLFSPLSTVPPLTSDYPIGVNYGVVTDNFLPSSQVATFLKTQTTISHHLNESLKLP
jgi:hypothetical protein